MIKMAEKTTQHFEYWAAKAKETTKDVKEKEATTKDEKGGTARANPARRKTRTRPSRSLTLLP